MHPGQHLHQPERLDHVVVGPGPAAPGPSPPRSPWPTPPSPACRRRDGESRPARRIRCASATSGRAAPGPASSSLRPRSRRPRRPRPGPRSPRAPGSPGAPAQWNDGPRPPGPLSLRHRSIRQAHHDPRTLSRPPPRSSTGHPAPRPAPVPRSGPDRCRSPPIRDPGPAGRTPATPASAPPPGRPGLDPPPTARPAPSRRSAPIVTVCRSGPYRAPLSSRLSTIWRRALALPCTTRSSGISTSSTIPRSATRGAKSPAARSTTGRSSTGSTRSRVDRRSARLKWSTLSISCCSRFVSSTMLVSDRCSDSGFGDLPSSTVSAASRIWVNGVLSSWVTLDARSERSRASAPTRSPSAAIASRSASDNPISPTSRTGIRGGIPRG